MTLTAKVIILLAIVIALLVVIWIGRRTSRDLKPKNTDENPWDHLSSEKEDTVQKLTEVLTEAAKPDPNHVPKPRGATKKGSFSIEGNKSMSLDQFHDIVCNIKPGEEIGFVPYEGRLCGVYGEFFVGTPYRYNKEKELMRRISEGEEMFAMCTYNRSWYGDKKDIMFFELAVEYEFGPKETNTIAQEIDKS